MPRCIRLSLLSLLIAAAAPAAAEEASPWYRRLWDGTTELWRGGASELYLPFHTHHLRFAYTRDKIDEYQENTFGIGYGSGRYRDNGDWHGLYAMGFQDSHFKPSYMAGYGYMTYWRPAEDLRLGVGFTAFLMARSDYAGYIPFPAALPIASLGYKNLSLETAYVPGGKGNGNVLFVWARYQFGNSGPR